MDFDTFIVILLVCLIVGILVAVYVYQDPNTTITEVKEDINNIKEDTNNLLLDANKDLGTPEIKIKKDTVYSDLERRYLFGSPDRNLDLKVLFCPEDNCTLKLIELINNSKISIDCSIYDIDDSSISDALIEKKNKGLQVRLVTDYIQAATKASMIGKLKVADINVIVSPESSSIMHNKFCVFDKKIVWVGSFNFTINDAHRNNNNVLIVNDKEVAELYSNKVNSFFEGVFSQDINPSIQINRIGNGEFYFCPEDNCSTHVLSLINDSNLSIECMFYSFTLDQAGDSIIQKNISKRFIFEKTQESDYSEYSKLKNAGVSVLLDLNPQNMHNKFCIIDNKIVLTGSMNLSVNGTQKNDESLVFIYNEEVARSYLDYFNKYWDLWN